MGRARTRLRPKLSAETEPLFVSFSDAARLNPGLPRSRYGPLRGQSVWPIAPHFSHTVPVASKNLPNAAEIAPPAAGKLPSRVSALSNTLRSCDVESGRNVRIATPAGQRARSSHGRPGHRRLVIGFGWPSSCWIRAWSRIDALMLRHTWRDTILTPHPFQGARGAFRVDYVANSNSPPMVLPEQDHYDRPMRELDVARRSSPPPGGLPNDLDRCHAVIVRQANYIGQLQRDLAEARRELDRLGQDGHVPSSPAPRDRDLIAERELLRATWQQVGSSPPTPRQISQSSRWPATVVSWFTFASRKRLNGPVP